MMLIVVVATKVVTSKKYFPCSGICFRTNQKTNTGHKHVDGFDGVCGDKEKNDDGGGDSFVAILFGGGGNVSNWA